MDLALRARDQQLALRAAVLARLVALWPALDVQRLDETWPAWALAAGQLVGQGHAASTALAGRYLQAARFAAGVPGPPVIVPAATLPAEQVVTALRVTGPVAVKRAISAGQDPVAAMETGLVRSSGAATRLVLAGGRDTVVASVRADPRATGWSRITGGNACDFCAMLADRGAVYRSEETASFESHDHCACAAAAEYEAASTDQTDSQGEPDSSQEE